MMDWTRFPIDTALDFRPASMVLDVGCGGGDQACALRAGGVRVIGVDVGRDALVTSRSRGLDVACARAEALPFLDRSMDGIVCKVVLPYTAEHVVIGEMARVMKPGARASLVTHGAGYYLRYAVAVHDLRHAFYGVRTLINTWVFAATGRRLPGFLGDSLYQSRRRLRRYCRTSGLAIRAEHLSRPFLTFPVFLCHELEKVE